MMGRDSKIEWTHHTFNPWRGCTKVSAGCANCYAEKQSGRNPRVLGVWGPNGTREVAAEAYWRQPLAWDREAAAAGERRRVFCASLADVFEGRDTMPRLAWDTIDAARRRLFRIVTETPNLNWLVLTKRPENALQMMVDAGLYAVANPSLPCPQPNLWIGTSVENQEAADERIPHLLRCPAAVRFLSCEPLLGLVNIRRVDASGTACESIIDPLAGALSYNGDTMPADGRIHWVIVGGESGPHARPMNIEWARDIVRQCKAVGVACFVKQLGSNAVDSSLKDVWCNRQHHYTRPAGHTMLAEAEAAPGYSVKDCSLSRHLRDPKGGDMAEWPEDLRVREFPNAMATTPEDTR